MMMQCFISMGVSSIFWRLSCDGTASGYISWKARHGSVSQTREPRCAKVSVRIFALFWTDLGIYWKSLDLHGLEGFEYQGGWVARSKRMRGQVDALRWNMHQEQVCKVGCGRYKSTKLMTLFNFPRKCTVICNEVGTHFLWDP